jgi:hypothetical protein
VPHHCFHVFAVYPWLGLMRTGVVEEPLRVLDLCRTTPARVEAVGGDTARVLARPLLWDGRKLHLGDWTPREARWQEEGLAFVRPPRPGDWVSLHWDFVCDRLGPAEVAALERATRRALRAVNSSSAAEAALA